MMTDYARVATAVGDDPALVAQYSPFIDAGLNLFGIYDANTVRAAYGTTAVECDYRWLTELASGAEYEGRADLGNTVPGYGVKYKGRGFCQITGYTHYLELSHVLGIDLVGNPDLAARPDIAGKTLGYYFKTHNIQAMANAWNIVGIRLAVNGGTNGLDRFETVMANLADVPITGSGPVVTVTTLYVNESIQTNPRIDPKIPAVADLAAGCIVTFTKAPPAYPAGVTPHWAHVQVVSGSTQRGKPAKGLSGWLLRANLGTRVA